MSKVCNWENHKLNTSAPFQVCSVLLEESDPDLCDQHKAAIQSIETAQAQAAEPVTLESLAARVDALASVVTQLARANGNGITKTTSVMS